MSLGKENLTACLLLSTHPLLCHFPDYSLSDLSRCLPTRSRTPTYLETMKTRMALQRTLPQVCPITLSSLQVSDAVTLSADEGNLAVTRTNLHITEESFIPSLRLLPQVEEVWASHFPAKLDSVDQIVGGHTV